MELPEFVVRVDFKVLLELQDVMEFLGQEDQQDPKDHLVYLVDLGVEG